MCATEDLEVQQNNINIGRVLGGLRPFYVREIVGYK